jgi:hypothetical protein
MRKRTSIPLLAVAALAPAAALALGQPSNDERQNAARISHLPALVGGTTKDATLGEADRGTCATSAGSVWYRLDPGRTRRVVARLRASGDLDATVDVYLRLRSRQRLLTCDIGDAHGRAAVGFLAHRGQSYLIRVARRTGSPSGDFTLGVEGAGGPRLPGPALPAGGVSGSLDRVERTAQAWSVRMRTGVRYRVSLVHRGAGCVRASIYRAGVRPRPGRPALEALPCNGYGLFTPRARDGERFSVLVRAAGGVRGDQRYRLQIARAGRDDSAPGVFVPNYARLRGSLDRAGVDAIDLFRFDVTRRSVLFLHLRSPRQSAAVDLLLIDRFGNVMRCACGGGANEALHKGLHPGRFFIAARARGGALTPYTLLRASRTITKTHLTVDGHGFSLLAPGRAATVAISTEPAVTGPATVTFEQFDPLSGWQFVRSEHVRVAAGRATLHYTPPSEGRWRATATYDGTRGTAPSATGFVRMLVAAPLRD